MSTMRPHATRSFPLVRSAGLALAAGLALSACTAAGAGSDRDSARATELADQLNQNLADAGLPSLDTETATTLYGTDGGVACENVGELQFDLSLAQFGNNSGNLRRVVMDPSLFDFDQAVIETYCPDKVDEFRQAVDELDTEETIP